MVKKLIFILALASIFFSCKKNYENPIPDNTVPIPKNPVTSLPITGQVSYTLSQNTTPSTDEVDAYKRIKIAMDSAIYLYNRYTTFTKVIKVNYAPSVPTANGSINGTINFGSGRQYMKVQTAMHEMSHTMGVGTTGRWTNTLIVNGLYTGANAIAELKKIDPTAILEGGAQHFWPGGLNYSQSTDTEADLIIHCRLVNAMKADGL